MNNVYVVHIQEKEQGLKLAGVFESRDIAMVYIRDNAGYEDIDYCCYKDIPSLINWRLLYKKIEVVFQQDIPKIILKTAERDYILEEVPINNFFYHKPVTFHLPDVETDIIQDVESAKKYLIKKASKEKKIDVKCNWTFNFKYAVTGTDTKYSFVKVEYIDENYAILYMKRESDGLHKIFSINDIQDSDLILIANFIKGILPGLCQIKK